MPKLGEQYMVDASKQDGILIVAFPNKNTKTDLEFSFWKEMVPVNEVVEDDNADEELIMMIIIGTSYCCCCTLCCSIIYIIRRKRMQSH